jgi:hypothetical protein
MTPDTAAEVEATILLDAERAAADASRDPVLTKTVLFSYAFTRRHMPW